MNPLTALKQFILLACVGALVAGCASDGSHAHNQKPLNVLHIGGGASHDYDRWFSVADSALLNATGRAAARYLEPPQVTVADVRSADVLIISANKAFPDPTGGIL